jgi:gas vesicle protein
MACAIEDAGFEIRDQIMWVYGSGFPKSHNLKDEWESWGTALKPAHEPIVMARKPLSEKTISSNVKKHSTGAINIDGCRVGTDEISVHNAPKGTFAGGELDRGSDTNSYKIHIGRWPANFIHDGSEEVVENFPETAPSKSGIRRNKSGMGIHDSEKGTFGKGDVFGGYDDSGSAARFFYCPKASKQDRNEGVNIWDVEDLKLELIDINQLIKDISEDYLMEKCEWNTIMSMNNIMDQSKKDLIFIISMVSKLITDLKTYNVSQNLNIKEYIQDVSKQFQENGLNLVENAEQIKILKQNTTGEKMELVLGVSLVVLKMLLKIKEIENRTSGHPTVKPTDLMKYLCRLITPKNGTILDPFMGSGSTGKAALLQGFSFVGIERDEEYFKIAEKRIKNVNS